MLKARTYLVLLGSTCVVVMAFAAVANIVVDPYAMHGVLEIDKLNRVKEESGSHAHPARLFKLYDPPEFAALKAADAQLYAAGMPNALDLPVDVPRASA